MYLGQLAKHYSNMADLRKATVTELELKKCGIPNANHGKRLLAAISALRAHGGDSSESVLPASSLARVKGPGGTRLAKVLDKA